MKRGVLAIAALLAIVAAVAAIRPAAAAPSWPLSRALQTLRSVDGTSFSAVVYWSRHGAPRPFPASTPAERAEIQVLDLPGADREAVLAWLRGEGRSALYARGASDGDIGSRFPQNMTPAAPSPTPNPYRSLTFASGSIGNHPAGGIYVLGGFAAVKRDGKAAVVCVSFKNVSPKTATRVVFAFPLTGPRGGALGELELDRRGEFSPNVDINGWPDLGTWQGGIGHRGYGDNCTFVDQGVASQPLLRAAGASYHVKRVDYADGTSWPG
ncbi:MAG TPA: hypothetical protein VMH02_00625 [Verrucomicrobiae bacterium]|nr:hypothetical protein [Verrucomicrobiae bacterium]